MNKYIAKEIPLLRKTYELYVTFYTYSNLFPKKDKYTLAIKCENCILSIIELLLTASNLPKSEKLPCINQAIIKLDILKILLRLCKDVDALELKKYINIQKQIQEIGRMLGGWQRSLK